MLGNPYARRSGELGDNERERAGGDRSEGTFDERPRPTEEEAECDLDGREAYVCGSRFSGAMVDAVVMAVNGGYEYEET